MFAPIGPLGESVAYIKGQLEEAPTTGYRHWQLVLITDKNVRGSWVIKHYPGGQWANCRSVAAEEYVWKEDTRVPETQFELGTKPFRRNVATDWARVKQLTQSGSMDAVPDDIFVRYYFQLKRIALDAQVPVEMQRVCYVFWGKTGTGKSHTAWRQAGMDAFPKNSRTKWWDGYRGQEHVIVDEFRGVVDVANLLVWTDKYPVSVEIKGGTTVLRATTIWLTSNLHPDQWYPDLDAESRAALMRRLRVVQFPLPLGVTCGTEAEVIL